MSGPDATAAEPMVVAVGGDGIGPEVVSVAIAVLQAAGFRGDFVEAPAGWGHWLETGASLPVDTFELIERHGVCLFGATTSRPSAEADAIAAERGLAPWISPILELRRRLGLDISMRPARSFAGAPGNALRRAPDGHVHDVPIDLLVVRQNTEGLYSGIEWVDPPADVRAALASHPRWTLSPSESLAVTVRVVTPRACRRLLEAAFAAATERGESELVLAEKPNVLRATSGLVLEEARRVADRFPGVKLVEMNIDAVLMELVARPERFGVIATTNLFGDLLSDAAAALVGGPGFAPSSNLGARHALFEPVHGSAPDIAGTGRANPIAAMLSAAMLSDHVGQPDVATRVVRAIHDAVGAGLATSTVAIGEAVIARLG